MLGIWIISKANRMVWLAAANAVILGGVVWGNILTTIIVTVFMMWITVPFVMYATVRNVAWNGVENKHGGIIHNHIINIHMVQFTTLVISVQHQT